MKIYANYWLQTGSKVRSIVLNKIVETVINNKKKHKITINDKLLIEINCLIAQFIENIYLFKSQPADFLAKLQELHKS